MNCSSVDSALKELSQLEVDPRLTPSMKEHIPVLQMDLILLKMYICCLDQWNLHSGSTKMSHFVATTLNLTKADKCLHTAGIAALDSGEFEDWNILVSKLLERIELICMPKIKTDCLDLLDCVFECQFSISELQKFVECIVISLNNLVRIKADMSLDLKMQLEALKVKVNLFLQLMDFSIKRSETQEQIKVLAIHLQAWAYKAACLTILYWAQHGNEENTAAKLNAILFDLLQKIKPLTPEGIGMYLAVLTASEASPSEIMQTSEVVVDVVDFILENVAVPIEDAIHTLREGLTILIIFLMEKSHKNKKPHKLKSVLRKADDIINDAAAVISSLCVDELEETIVEERSGFHLEDLKKMMRHKHISEERSGFHLKNLKKMMKPEHISIHSIKHQLKGSITKRFPLAKHHLKEGIIERIDALKAEIIELYPPISNSLSFNYPTTNLIGFLDLFLENLENMLKWKLFTIPPIKHQFVILQQELQSLRPFLKDVQQLQSKHDEVKQLWTQIVNTTYRVVNAINSFCYMHHCLWNEMICLSNATEEIKLIKSEVLKTRDQHAFNIQDVNAEMSSNLMVPIPANLSRIDEVVVGFDDVAKVIIDRLTKGSEKLDIVSIVGMPGLGKTTLAKKVYNDPSVKCHFHKCAWSCVSQSYEIKKLLKDILNDVAGTSCDVSKKSKEDLEEELKKSLRGQRYLIILDDIWDITAWDQLQQSFPDDANGSRIMFTSRETGIALEAKSDCFIHHLNPLSDEESWMLLQQKLFNKDGFPPTFSEVGKEVAKNCKGVPLSIVVIAGLLAKRVESLDWWNQIARFLGSLVARGQCKDILELSYKHLPEFLKPCFLYLGVFEEDKEIEAQKLIRLWISEGFVHSSGEKNLENVAKKFLMDLVTRSLVIISSRSSTGGIKTCRIHDLLREFCLEKGEKENFSRLVCPSNNFYYHYRLSIQAKGRFFLNSNPVGPCIHSLVIHQKQGDAIHDLKCLRLREFICLQVLDVKYFRANYSDFEAITSLVLLRFLAVHCVFSDVPPSVVHLVNLETIYLKASKTFFLSQNIWTPMKKLRHVKIAPSFVDETMSSRHHKPGECSQLEDLRTFSTLNISQEEQPGTFFRRMPSVRKLKLILNSRAQFPMLHFLSELESLNLENAVFGRMSSPHALNFPSTLMKLTLKHSFLYGSAEISLIGNLPNLEVLKLLGCSIEEDRWDIEDEGFSKLRFLKLQDVNLAQWNSSDDSFPCLEQLEVDFCKFLEEIPSNFAYIPTLKKIKIYFCGSRVVNSARQIEEEQLDMGNDDFELDVFPTIKK